MSQPLRSAPPRLLRRSRDDRVVAGVCGGLGRYLGVDPVLLRIAFVVLTIAGGTGLLIYVVAALLIPNEVPGEHPGVAPQTAASTLRVMVGTGLIALGTILLIGRFFPWFERVTGPLTLIAIGVAVLVWGVRR